MSTKIVSGEYRPLFDGTHTLPAPTAHGFGPRWGATSFVVPGTWSQNVRALGPSFDDIELLFFESAPESFPDSNELDQLRRLKQLLGLSYSLHTPLDVSLASACPVRREHSLSVMKRCIVAAEPLEPEAFIVHVYLGDSEHDPEPPRDHGAWLRRAAQSLTQLCELVDSPRRLCIESLDYDLELLLPVLEELDLSVALDVGHLARDGKSLERALGRLLPRTRVIQIHGTDSERDHRSLEHYPQSAARTLMQALRECHYRGVFTLEVFSKTYLQRSVQTLESWLSSF